MPEFLWQNHGRRHHRTGQRAAARFINSRNANDTEGAQFFFITKTAAPVHRLKIIYRFILCQWFVIPSDSRLPRRSLARRLGGIPMKLPLSRPHGIFCSGDLCPPFTKVSAVIDRRYRTARDDGTCVWRASAEIERPRKELP